MDDMGFNPLITQYIVEGTTNTFRHALDASDVHKKLLTLHKDGVHVSLDGGDFLKMDTRLKLYFSKYDGEKSNQKFAQAGEALSLLKSYVIYEIAGSIAGIQVSFVCNEADVGLIIEVIKTMFPKSHYSVEPAQDENEYHAVSFLPTAPFYKALTPSSELNTSPLNTILNLMASSKREMLYQAMIAPVPPEWRERIKQAIDTDFKCRLPLDHSPTPPSVARDFEQEKYKDQLFHSNFSLVVRILDPDRAKVEFKAFIAPVTYGGKKFAAIKYKSKRFISLHPGFMVNASGELPVFFNFPFETLSRENNLVACTPEGQIPQEKNENRSVFGYWTGPGNHTIWEPESRSYPHVHVMGLPRTGKSLLLKHLALTAIRNNNSVVIVFDLHGDLHISTGNEIEKLHIKRGISLDFTISDYVLQLSLRENYRYDDYGMIADEITEGFKGSLDAEFFRARMMHIFLMLFYAYSVDTSLSVADVIEMTNQTSQGRNIRIKVAAKINHPLVKDFLLNEMGQMSYAQLGPVRARLARFLIHNKNYRLFSNKKHSFDFAKVMENTDNPFVLINLASGKLGMDRSQTIGSLILGIITSHLFSRIDTPFEKRKKLYLIIDEFYLLGQDNLCRIIEQASKFNVQLVLANQGFHQLSDAMKQSVRLMGSRIFFKTAVDDAEKIVKEMRDVEVSDILGLKPFTALALIGQNTYKISTPRPTATNEGFGKEILRRSIKQYYIPLNEPAKQEILPFDTL